MVDNDPQTRRGFIRATGSAAIVAALAGCTGGGGNSGGGNNGSGNGNGGQTTTGGGASMTQQQMSADQIPTADELVATLGADVANFDPTKINDTTSDKAFGLVYESLLGVDFEGKTHPTLATEMQQQGKTSFRAKLRKGVKFHKGNGEMTAQDVKSSFERYKGTVRETDVFDWYKSSKIVDDYTLDIELKRPYAPFKTSIASVPIVPKEATGKLDLTKNPIGTGPYQFVEHQPDNLFRIERNDNHWFEGSEMVPAKPPIKRITFRVITEQSAQLGALQGGDVQFINDPPAPSVSNLKNNGKFTVTGVIDGGFDMFIYPLGVTPFDNAKVRRGVTRLIPREAIVKSVYKGQAIPAHTPFAPLVGDFVPKKVRNQVKQQYAGYDQQAGKKLLKQGFNEAGVSKPFKTTIVSNDNPQRVQWSQLIKQSLNSTGYFNANVQQFEFNTYLEKVLAKDAYKQNNIVALGWSAGFDPDDYVNNLFTKDNFAPACCNINHYNNQQVANLISKGLRTYDTQQRSQFYTELTRTLGKEAPMAFVQFGKANDAMTNKMKNWQTYPIDGGEYDPLYMPYADQVAWLEK